MKNLPVAPLAGGIHTYCEDRTKVDARQEEPEKVHNYFLGSNFVFDRRAQLPGGSGVVVGKCTECQLQYDQFDGADVCTACVCPVLVCGTLHPYSPPQYM